MHTRKNLIFGLFATIFYIGVSTFSIIVIRDNQYINTSDLFFIQLILAAVIVTALIVIINALIKGKLYLFVRYNSYGSVDRKTSPFLFYTDLVIRIVLVLPAIFAFVALCLF